MMAEMTYYKCLTVDGRGPFSGFAWPLPTRRKDGTWRPGRWVAVRGALEMCENGLHACTLDELPCWLTDHIYTLEYDPRSRLLDDGQKCVGRRARLLAPVEAWNARTARLFACDCAERVLSVYEAAYPDDNRPREAIAIARRYADGVATGDELCAAYAAARAAADDAYDAAYAAARAADAVAAATRAAAARAAYAVAARAADAAADAAAGAVAVDAAADAAYAAARAAAADAADAARAAAAAANRDERAWQAKRLGMYLRGEEPV